MSTKIVKNVSGADLAIPNIGLVRAGDEISVPSGFNNANFSEEYADESEETEPKKSKRVISNK